MTDQYHLCYVSLCNNCLSLKYLMHFAIKSVVTLCNTWRTLIVSFSRFIWITNSSDHRRVWTASWLSGLGNYFVCKRFTIQTFLWSLEFVIQINHEHDTIAVWNLARSWTISTDALCNNSLSHFVKPDALCNNSLSHFVIKLLCHTL